VLVKQYEDIGADQLGPARSRGRPRTAVGRDPRRGSKLGFRPRQGLSPPEYIPGGLGHGG